MTGRSQRRKPPPLDAGKLDELALRYVGRFATTRARLADYLHRKVRERGWAETTPPAIERIVARCAESGYVDDQAFALAKARALTGRGYGVTRVRQALRVAGVDEPDGEKARAHAEEGAVEAALRFARRRRIGPFATQETDRPGREKAIAAMVRAGHGFALARAIASLPPGAAVDDDELGRTARLFVD